VGARRGPELLKYSQVGSRGAEREVTRFSDLIASAVASLQRAIEETDTVIQIGELTTLCVDASLFVQVLQNLLSNAIKFRSEAPPRIRIEATYDKGLWTCSVADNGLGMNMLYAERVFQMFRRPHDRGRFSGSGSGLAIVKRIVEQHGGRVWLDSEPGRGTTVCFTVPEAARALPGAEH
jgi:light-regulated signal transduction histidine kinase (bacteriophytochrome)